MPGEGIDFYIDAARFLPENVGFTRIIVHGYQSDGRPFINPVTCDSSISLSKVRCPFYGLRNEL